MKTSKLQRYLAWATLALIVVLAFYTQALISKYRYALDLATKHIANQDAMLDDYEAIIQRQKEVDKKNKELIESLQKGAELTDKLLEYVRHGECPNLQ